MIEVHIVRKIVHSHPLNWPILSESGAYWQQFNTVSANLAVALHANFSRWQRSESTALDSEVTEPTIETEIARVEFVTEFDGLNWAIPDRKIFVGPVVGHSHSAEQCEQQESTQSDQESNSGTACQSIPPVESRMGSPSRQFTAITVSRLFMRHDGL